MAIADTAVPPGEDPAPFHEEVDDPRRRDFINIAAVAWIGVGSPYAALDLLRAMEARTQAVESFEIVPGEALHMVLDHIPGTRAPLAEQKYLQRRDWALRKRMRN